MALGAGEPESVGGYRLVERLGAGGMGVVYLARSMSGRRYALKVIRAEYADAPEFRTRFRREVAAAQRVSGAFTAPVVDADPDGEPPWLATQFIPGDSLARRVARDGPVSSLRELATFAGQLAEALRAIHRAGLVHRDLKPGNILLTDDGPRVIDFGITRAVTDSRRLTESGRVLGTPPFMAPEQLRDGTDVTAAADVFALGAVVAFAATGHSPFEAGPDEGNDALIVAYRVVHEEPNLEGLPRELLSLVRACLDKDPARRPDLDVVERMAAWAAGHPLERATVGLRSTPLPKDDAPHGRTPQERTPTQPDRPAARARVGARPRRLLAVLATALSVAVIAGGAVYWLNMPEETGSSPRKRGNGTGSWEVDLVQLGVPNALESGFACTAASDGDLLCTDGNRLTIKLNPADGTEQWRYDGPEQSGWDLSAVERDGTVYAQAAEGSGIVALDLATGKVRRTYAVPELRGRLVPTASGIIAQSGEKELRLYDVRSPRVLNTWHTDGDTIDSVASGGKRVTVVADAADDSAGSMVEGTNSSLSEHLAWAFAQNVEDDPDMNVPQGTLSALDTGTSAIYLAEQGDRDSYIAVNRLNEATSGMQRVALKPRTDRPMIVVDDMVYAPAGDGSVTAVDIPRDRIAWRVRSGARGISEVTAHKGQLLLTDAQGRLHALDEATGAHRFTGDAHRGSVDPDADQHAPAPVVLGKHVYVVTPGNTLYRTPLPQPS